MAREESDLIQRAIGGDSRAFAALCEPHRERVWRIAAGIAGGTEAEDLAQEAFLKAFRSLRSYRGEASFQAWLSRIVLNVAHDFQRSSWRRWVIVWNHPIDESGGVAPDSEAVRRETELRVNRCVAALPMKLRVPVWLHYFDGFGFAEISRLEGVPESTIRSRIKTALQRLSKELADLLEDSDEPFRLELEARSCRS